MNNNVDLKRVVTGEVRTSYCHLTKPRAAKPGDTPKYGITLLIPKSDISTKQRIDAAINAAITEAVAGKWNGTRPPQPALPIYDGDGVRPNGEAFTEECRGCWVLTASSEQKPEVVDANLNPILNETEIYSGMYARASIRFFGYFNSGKKGIGCGLGNVQKVRDGEVLGGGRRSAADDFGSGFAAPATPAYSQHQSVPTPAPMATPSQYHTDTAGNTYQLINNQWVMIRQANPAPVAPIAPTPVYPSQAAPIDPITGRPVLGQVMGL